MTKNLYIDPVLWGQQVDTLAERIEIPPRSFLESDVDRALESQGVPIKGRDYVRRRLSEGPSRGGDSSDTLRNLSSDFFSPKMGHTVVCESGTNEQVFYSLLDALPSVLGYLEQPPQVRFKRYTIKGHLRADFYTPDVIVILRDRVYVIEIKFEETLHGLCETHPKNWRFMDGRYEFIQAKEFFSELGFEHFCWFPSPESQLITQNLNLLQSLAKKDTPDANIQRSLIELLRKRKVAVASDLLKECKQKSAADLLHLVREGKLSAPLDICNLAEIDNLWLSENSNLARNAAEKSLDLYAFGTAGRMDAVKALSPKREISGLRRLAILEAGGKSRSVRRYLRKLEEGLENGLTPVDALADKEPDPKTDKRFRSGREPIVMATLKEFVENPPDGFHKLRPTAQYDLYTQKVSNVHLEAPVCRKTFAKARDAASDIESREKSRGGRRAANAVRDPTPVSKRLIEPRRPFERAITDHYHMDQFVVVFETATEIWFARPVLSVLLDLATNDYLAATISIEVPSRRSVGRLIRMCGRLHRRLSEAVNTDRGADFRSIYTRAVHGHYEVSTIATPGEDGRSGGQAETFFRQLQLSRLQFLDGNFANGKPARSISATHKPQAGNIVDLKQLVSQTAAHCNWRSDERLFGASETPTVKMQRLMEVFPFSGCPIEYNSEFITATAIDHQNPLKVIPGKGFKIGDRWYFDSALRPVIGKRVNVRLDPENPNVAFAYLAGFWQPCYSRGQQTFFTKSPAEREIESLLAELPNQLTDAQDRSSRIKNLDSIDETRDAFTTTEPVPATELSPSKARRVDGAEPRPSPARRRSNRTPLEVTSWN